MFRVLAQQEGEAKKTNKVSYKRTFNGNIIKILDEQYIFKMPCGVNSCIECETNRNTNLVISKNGPQVMEEGGVMEEQELYKTIYILDDSFVNNQIDFIDHYDQLCN